MFIQFFKKSASQTETNIKIKGMPAEVVAVSYSLSSLISQIGTKNRKFYKATRSQFSDCGEGTYFAVQLKNTYVFAFMTPDWKVAKIIYKEGKSYVTKSFSTTRRTDKTWIYEVSTTDSKLYHNSNEASTEYKEKVISAVEENSLEDLSKEELIEIILMMKKSNEEKDKEIEEVKEELELAKEENVKLDRKRKHSFKSANKFRNKNKIIIAMINSGINPGEALKRAKRVESELDSMLWGL